MSPKKTPQTKKILVKPVAPPPAVQQPPEKTKPVVVPKVEQSNRSMMLGVGVVVILLGLVGGYFGYTVIKDKPASTSVAPLVSHETTVNDNNEDTNSETSTVNTNSTSETITTPKPSGGATVTWTAAKSVTILNLLGKNSVEGLSLSPDLKPVYDVVGTFNTGTYKDQQLVRVQFYYEGPQQYPTIEYYAVKGQTGILLFKPSNPNIPNQYTTVEQVMIGYTTRGLTVDTSTTIDGLFAPSTIIGPKPHQILVRDPYPVGEFDATGMVVAFTDSLYGPVYINSTPVLPTETTPETLREVTINQRHGFYLKLADGMIAIYQLKYDFITYDDTVGHGPNGGGILKATWTDGKVNTQLYDTTLKTGCGSINYSDVVQPSEVNLAIDLVQVGTTVTGEIVYGFKDPQSAALQKWYQDSYQVYNEEIKKTYVDFVADHPIVFVVDSFNRLVRITSAAYQIQAECGKPVIYLYPTSTTNVDVSLYPQGGFTKSEPAYNDGWHVTAQPDGQLTELSSGRIYPYLFWEGRGGIYSSPKQGFVVAKKDVHNFLVSKLNQLGLNEQLCIL